MIGCRVRTQTVLKLLGRADVIGLQITRRLAARVLAFPTFWGSNVHYQQRGHPAHAMHYASPVTQHSLHHWSPITKFHRVYGWQLPRFRRWRGNCGRQCWQFVSFSPGDVPYWRQYVPWSTQLRLNVACARRAWFETEMVLSIYLTIPHGKSHAR